jgi:hypothetical protein
MRLRFWRWAHDRAERLWHWIYYNRLPEGIAQRQQAKIRQDAGFQYSVIYVAKDGTIVPVQPETKVTLPEANG